jgi:hypothetical protein
MKTGQGLFTITEIKNWLQNLNTQQEMSADQAIRELWEECTPDNIVAAQPKDKAPQCGDKDYRSPDWFEATG